MNDKNTKTKNNKNIKQKTFNNTIIMNKEILILKKLKNKFNKVLSNIYNYFENKKINTINKKIEKSARIFIDIKKLDSNYYGFKRIINILEDIKEIKESFKLIEDNKKIIIYNKEEELKEIIKIITEDIELLNFGYYKEYYINGLYIKEKFKNIIISKINNILNKSCYEFSNNKLINLNN